GRACRSAAHTTCGVDVVTPDTNEVLTGHDARMLELRDVHLPDLQGLSPEASNAVQRLLAHMREQGEVIRTRDDAIRTREASVLARNEQLRAKDKELKFKTAKLEKITFELARLK